LSNTPADISRRDQLVLDHLPLVAAIARRLQVNLPNHVEWDDLVQAGTLGLIDAAAKYDLTKRIVFPAYANHRIRGAILDSLRQLDCASRSMRRQHKQIAIATADLTMSLNRDPSEAEVADRLGITLERLRKILLDLRGLERVSVCYFSDKHEDSTTRDFPCETKCHPDSIAGQAELRGALREAMATLSKREQLVLTLYHRYNQPMSKIAKQLGINESRVSQIHAAALDKMGGALRGKGIHSSRLF
jgi:RNA polymerase sigma factor for flagellar operon FliA